MFLVYKKIRGHCRGAQGVPRAPHFCTFFWPNITEYGFDHCKYGFYVLVLTVIKSRNMFLIKKNGGHCRGAQGVPTAQK